MGLSIIGGGVLSIIGGWGTFNNREGMTFNNVGRGGGGGFQ